MAYQQYTRLDLRNRLKLKFESVPFFTDEECNFMINEVLQWYNLYTGVWKTRVLIPTVAGQVYYTLPSTVVFDARMEYNGMPLANTWVDDLDTGQPGWEAETTATPGVPSQISVWAPVGMNTIAVWPADAAGANSLLLDGVHATPVLNTDGAYLDLDETEVDTLLGEVLFLLCFKDPSRTTHTMGWHEDFLRLVGVHNGRLLASNEFRSAQGLDATRERVPMAIGVTQPKPGGEAAS